MVRGGGRVVASSFGFVGSLILATCVVVAGSAGPSSDVGRELVVGFHNAESS